MNWNGPPGGEAARKSKVGEQATETATLQFGVGSFDRKRGDIDAQYVEAALRQPKRIRPRTRADLERHGGLYAIRSDELDEQRLWLARIPGKLSRCVAFVPGMVRHHSTSVAPNQLRQPAGVDGQARMWRTKGRQCSDGPWLPMSFSSCPAIRTGVSAIVS